MKPEIKDIVVELTTKTAPAGGLTFVSAHWWATVNWTGVLTGILIVLQILYVLRKWWREETAWGRKMRTWAENRGLVVSKPMELDE